MEYWRVGVLKKGIKPSAITPLLQYSNTAKLIQIESAHDRLPSFGSWIRRIIIVNSNTDVLVKSQQNDLLTNSSKLNKIGFEADQVAGRHRVTVRVCCRDR
jgi:hypothetical protein